MKKTLKPTELHPYAVEYRSDETRRVVVVAKCPDEAKSLVGCLLQPDDPERLKHDLVHSRMTVVGADRMPPLAHTAEPRATADTAADGRLFTVAYIVEQGYSIDVSADSPEDAERIVRNRLDDEMDVLDGSVRVHHFHDTVSVGEVRS